MSDNRADQSRLQAIWQSDVFYSFRRSPLALGASFMTILCIAMAILAPVLAPHCVEPVCLDLMDGLNPPVWTQDGVPGFILGTDEQGRDMLSAILYASRTSLLVGFSAVALAMVTGVLLGVVAGYFGGWVDVLIMRLADMQLTFPNILIALLIAGVTRSVLTDLSQRDILTGVDYEDVAIFVLIIAIALSDWPRFARVARGATMVELNKG